MLTANANALLQSVKASGLGLKANDNHTLQHDSQQGVSSDAKSYLAPV